MVQFLGNSNIKGKHRFWTSSHTSVHIRRYGITLYKALKSSTNDLVLLTIGAILIHLAFPNKHFFIPAAGWICLVPVLVVLNHNTSIIKKLFFSWIFFQAFFILQFSFNESPVPSNYHISHTFDGILLFTYGFPVIYSLFFTYISRTAFRLSVINIAYQTSLWVLLEFFIIEKVFHFPLSLALTNFNNAALIQLSSFGGIHLVSALIFAVNCSLSSIIHKDNIPIPGNKRLKKFAVECIPSAFLLVVVSLSLFYGNVLVSDAGTNEESYKFSLIQPNIGQQDLYVVSTSQPYFKQLLGKLLDMIILAKNEFSPDVVVLPEGVLKEKIFSRTFYYEFSDFVKNLNTPLIVQAVLTDNHLNKEFSSVIHYDEKGLIKHTNPKQVLVPFFESSLYDVGNTQSVFFGVRENLDIGSMICFEVLFTKISRGLYSSGANVLIALSNNGYFGISNWPFLHAAYAPFRAAEYRRPFILVNNTGFSVVTSATGKIEHYSPIGKRCISNVFVTPSDQKTFYGEHPFFFIGVCSLTFLLITLVRIHRM